MMKNRKHTIRSAVGIVLLGASASAAAHGDAAVIVPAIQVSQNAIVQAIQWAERSIVQQLQLLRNETNVASGKQAEAVAQAQENATQRSMDVQKELKVQEASRNTRMPIDPCANAAQSMGEPDYARVQPALRTGAMSPRYGGGGGAGGGKTLSTGSTSLNKAIQISDGVIAAPTPETQALMAHEGACQAYAAGTRETSCRDAGTPTGSATLPNADVRADTLFDGAQTKADTGKISLAFSDTQMAAAKAYLRNVSNPIALRELTKAEARTNEGRSYLALRDAHGSRLDLATRPYNEWINSRAKYKATIPVLQAMLEGQGAAAEYLAKELPKVAPDWRTEGVSLHQMMAFESARRYQNPAWIKEIAKATDPMTLAREQLVISALNADIATKQLIESQKTNLYLGAIYQASLNKDFMPEVIAQHRKATSTR